VIGNVTLCSSGFAKISAKSCVIAAPRSPSAAIDISAIALRSNQPQSVFTQLPTDDHIGRGAMIDWWRAMTLPPQQTPAGGKDAQFPRSRDQYSLLLEQNHFSRFPNLRNPQRQL